MQVQEIMTPDVQIADPNMTIRDAARRMRADNIGALPVGENDRLIGMITDRDIVVRAVAEGEGVERHTAGDVMSPQILYCQADQSVDDVLKDMGDQQIRRMPVVDRDMRLVGIVSLGDLSRTARPTEAGESLKEISSPPGH